MSNFLLSRWQFHARKPLTIRRLTVKSSLWACRSSTKSLIPSLIFLCATWPCPWPKSRSSTFILNLATFRNVNWSVSQMEWAVDSPTFNLRRRKMLLTLWINQTVRSLMGRLWKCSSMSNALLMTIKTRHLAVTMFSCKDLPRVLLRLS